MLHRHTSGVTILWWQQGGTGNATLFQWKRRTYEFCTSVDVVTEVLTDRPPCGATVAVSGPGIGRGRLECGGGPDRGLLRIRPKTTVDDDAAVASCTTNYDNVKSAKRTASGTSSQPTALPMPPLVFSVVTLWQLLTACFGTL